MHYTYFTPTTVSNITNGMNRPYIGSYFNDNEMRIFKTIIYDIWISELSKTIYFVASHKYESMDKRVYRLNKIDYSKGQTKTVSQIIGEYATKRQAKKLMHEIFEFQDRMLS